MSSSLPESVPPDPGTSRPSSNSLPLPQHQVKTPRTASLSHGSVNSSSTAVHDHLHRVRPTWTVKRYERTTKLEPPYLRDYLLQPFTTSFDDGWVPF